MRATGQVWYVSLFVAVSFGADIKLPGTYYQQGLTSLAIGKVDQAEQAFQESLRRDPSDLPALVGLAEIALRRNEPNKAADHLRKALGKAPQNAGVQTAWARYLYTQRRFPEAEQAIRKAIQLDPKAVAPKVDLGDILYRALRRPKEAVKAYEEALALDPKHAGAHYALGLALAGSGELARAQAELEASARLAPTNPLPPLALGGLHVALGQTARALDLFAEALKVEPKFFAAHLARGDVFLAAGDRDKALTEFGKAAELAPHLGLAQVKLGMTWQAKGRAAEAEKAYLNAIALDPGQAVGFNNLAWLAAERKGNLDQALKWAQRATKLAPKQAQFQDTLGWVYRARGELGRALTVLREASAADPGSGEILYHLAVVYAEQRNTKAAVETLNKALSAQKDFAGANRARQLLADLRRR